MQAKYFVKQKLQVNTFDIDIAGHLNNIVYVQWIEILRTKLFTDFFDFKNIVNSNKYPVVISTNIDYKKQIKLFDEVEASFWLDKTEKCFCYFKFEVKVNDILMAKALQKCVIIELGTNKIINPKDFVKEL